MNDAYRALMEQQGLSEEEKQAMINYLLRSREKDPRPLYAKMAIAAMCLLMAIPITVLAVDNIFGISVVEIIRGNTTTNKFETGYEVSYPEVTTYQLSDFSEEIRMMEDYRLATYDTWQQAEEALGITLMNNTFLFDEGAAKERTYKIKKADALGREHCYVQYEGLDNQFYRATVTAAYRYDNMYISVRSVVTCEHPAILEEDTQRLHWSGMLYSDGVVEDITQEQYLAANGINATIVTIDQSGGRPAEYAATFFANGASYNITVKSGYVDGRADEAKETLIEILESFVF